MCEAENVRDFSVVVNPNFGLTTQTIGQTTIRVYTQTGAGAVTADKAAAALAGLNQACGTYPWPDLVLAEVGAYDGFSMEYPRAIHLTRSKVTDSYVINHEVAHQWFYAQLGNHQMLEPWLDEAFADFSARYLMGIGVNHCSSRDVDSSVFAPGKRGSRQAATGRVATGTSTRSSGGPNSSTRSPGNGQQPVSSPPCAISWLLAGTA